MIDLSKFESVFSAMKYKYLIIAIIFLFFLVVVILNTISYINILNQSTENPYVPKGRATAMLIADIILLLVLIFFTGYYGYRYFRPNPNIINNVNPFSFLSPKAPRFGTPIRTTDSVCKDADSTLLAEKIRLNKPNPIINLKPNNCSVHCDKFKDPRTLESGKCKNTYDASNIAKSFAASRTTR